MKEQRMKDSSAPRNSHAIAFALAAALPIAAGCAFLERPAPSGSQYLLMIPVQAPVAGSKLGTAMVARFSAIPPFDERGFLYKTTDGTWRVDGYNGFMSDPSDMLCEGFARGLEQSGRFTMVGIEGISVQCDLTLEGIIEGFYADYTGADGPAAVVEVLTYLLDGRGSRIGLVAQMRGKGRAAIASDKPGDIASAFAAASAQAIASVIGALPSKMGPVPQDAPPSQAWQRLDRGRQTGEVAVQPQNEG